MNKHVILWTIIASFVGSLLAIAFPTVSSAMPAFARKYDAPCSSCHLAFPKLNSFGIAFQQRGYRMEDEGPGKPVWKLPGIPIGGMAAVEYKFVDDDSMVPSQSSAIEFPDFEFFYGGVLGPNISFFGDFGADFDGDGGLTPDLAFILFNDLMSESRLNLKFGVFDAGFPFLSDARSPTSAGYLARISAAGPGSEGVALGRPGLEINGILPTGTRYALGVGNSEVKKKSNSVRAVHAWVTQTAELLGFDQTVGVLYSLDRNSDAMGAMEENTHAVGVAMDLHYGLTGLVLAYFHYEGGISEGSPSINSGLAEFLHFFSPELVGVARWDVQDVRNSSEAKKQYTGNLQYFFLPNVRAKAEVSLLEEKDSSGVQMDAKTATLSLAFGF